MANPDNFLRWQVRVLRDGEPARKALVARGWGAVGREVLPRWSADGNRLAVIMGNSPEDTKPSVELVDFVHASSTHTVTSTLVDAEALAGLYAATGIKYLDSDLWDAPARPDWGDSHWWTADIYSLGDERALVVDRAGIKVVRRHRIQVLARAASVLAVERRDASATIVVRNSAGLKRFKLMLGRIPSPANLTSVSGAARFAGVTDSDDPVYFADTEDGSFLWRSRSDGTRTALASANEFMAHIVRPRFVRIPYIARGEAREGVLFLPTQLRFGSRPPVIVTAYPAPRPLVSYLDYYSAVSGSMAWRWHPMLAAGFAVFVVDFRRPRPASPDSAEYIETPDLITSEVLPAVSAVKSEPAVDPERLGFAGFSYGGYTALTLLGKTQTFRAIIAEVPLADLYLNLSSLPEMHLLDCEPRIGLNGLIEIEAPEGFLRVGGPIYSRGARMITDSPLYNLQSAVTPTLLISAENDSFVTNAEEVYMMLLRRNVPTQLVTYWGETHDIESPGNVRDMLERQIAWFTKYLGGAHDQ